MATLEMQVSLRGAGYLCLLRSLRQYDACSGESVKQLLDGNYRDLPRGMSSGGVFLRVRRRCEMVCAIVNLHQPSQALQPSHGRFNGIFDIQGCLPLCSSRYRAVSFPLGQYGWSSIPAPGETTAWSSASATSVTVASTWALSPAWQAFW